jgi:hypothetical protein
VAKKRSICIADITGMARSYSIKSDKLIGLAFERSKISQVKFPIAFGKNQIIGKY